MSIPITTLHEIATAAGVAVLEIYAERGPVEWSAKADHSPVTAADLLSHSVISAALSRLTPDVMIVSEEGSADALPVTERFWLIDPLDGTKEFIRRTGEFTVNIALIENGRPVIGVVHAPALSCSWLTVPTGAERWDQHGRTKLTVRSQVDANCFRMVASRDHSGARVEALLKRLPNVETLSMGSSLKFCLVAEGKADLYLRDGPTMPWDTAAAHAVLSAAGGGVYSLGGDSLSYHAPGTPNPSFLAIGDQAFPWHSLIRETRV